MGHRLKRAQVVYKGCYTDGHVVEKRTKTVRLVDEDGKVLANVAVPTERVIAKAVPVLVTLRLPKGTRVNEWPSELASKARADRAEVIKIEDRSGRAYAEAYAKYDHSFKYQLGKVARVRQFDTNATQCSAGIHFHRGKERAWHWVGA